MPLTAQFLADFSSFIKACQDATTSTDELVEAAGKVGKTMDEGVALAAEKIKATGAGLVSFGKSVWTVLDSDEMKKFGGEVRGFFDRYIEAAKDGETQTALLAQAIKNSGADLPTTAKLYADLAHELSNVSTFSSTAITKVEALLTTVGHISPDNMKATLQATMDLAAGLQIDLYQAAVLVARAAGSDGEAIGKLKTILGDTVPKGADFAQIMEAINKQFGGDALANLNTTAGQMEHLKNQMADIDEMIGKSLASNLKTLFDLFNKLPEGVQTFVLAIVGLGAALAPVVVAFQGLFSLIGSIGPAIWAGVVAGWEYILPYLGPAGWIALGIIGLLSIWKYWDDIVAWVKKAWEGIKWALTQINDALTYLHDAWIRLLTNMVNAVYTWLVGKLTEAFNWVKQQIVSLVDTFKWMYNEVVGGSSVPDLVDGIASEFRRLDRVMVSPAQAAAQEVADAFAGIGQPTLSASAQVRAGGAGAGAGAPSVVVNMSGMLGTDDPQTRAVIRDLVSSAVMDGMRGARLLGTA